jgi:hypothetical protein
MDRSFARLSDGLSLQSLALRFQSLMALKKRLLIPSATDAENDQVETLLVVVPVAESGLSEELVVRAVRNRIRVRCQLRQLTRVLPIRRLGHDVSAESAQRGGLAIAELDLSDVVADAAMTDGAIGLLVEIDRNVSVETALSVVSGVVIVVRAQVDNGSMTDVTARVASVDLGTRMVQRMRGKTTALSLTGRTVESAPSVVRTIVLAVVLNDVTTASADVPTSNVGAMAIRVADSLGIASRVLRVQT